MDIGGLLNDIPGDSRCGEYLKYNRIYDDIREAKREDDPRLPQGVWKTEIKKADWNKVIDICSDIIKNKSKDLQIAVWLTEALSSTEKWEGMRDGIEHIFALCDKYWDDVYPVVEDGDYDYRMAPLASLVARLADISLRIPLTLSDEGGEEYGLSDWIDARYNSKINNSNAPFSSLQDALAASDRMFVVKSERSLKKTIDVIERLNNLLNDKAIDSAPSFSPLLTNVNDAWLILSNFMIDNSIRQWGVDEGEYVAVDNKPGDVGDDVFYEEREEDYESEEVHNDSSENDGDPLSQATLDQAFAALQQIASFIEQKEPQSPVVMLIRMALFLRNKTFTDMMSLQTKEGEPLVLCLAKMHNAINGDQSPKFDKSIFKEDE